MCQRMQSVVHFCVSNCKMWEVTGFVMVCEQELCSIETLLFEVVVAVSVVE